MSILDLYSLPPIVFGLNSIEPAAQEKKNNNNEGKNILAIASYRYIFKKLLISCKYFLISIF